VTQLSANMDVSAEVEWIRVWSPSVVIADLYRPTQMQVTQLARGPWVTAFIDDDSALEFDCDLLINPSLDSSFVHRRAARVEYLRGAAAAILRRQFDRMPPHPIQQAVKQLLICFGGSDPVGMTNRVVDWLAPALPRQVERATVVVGPGFNDADQLAKLIATDGRWRLLRAVSNMAELFQDADVAILAAGTLIHEAAATGLPGLFVALTADQEREAKWLAAAGAAEYLGRHTDVQPKALIAALTRLADAAVRQKISQRAQTLIDGRGGERIAERIAVACRCHDVK